MQQSDAMQFQLQGCQMIKGCRRLLLHLPLSLATPCRLFACLQNVLLTLGDATRGDGGGVRAKLADCGLSRMLGQDSLSAGGLGGWGGHACMHASMVA